MRSIRYVALSGAVLAMLACGTIPAQAETEENPLTGEAVQFPDTLDPAARDAHFREMVAQGLERIRSENFAEESARACEAQYRLMEGGQ